MEGNDILQNVHISSNATQNDSMVTLDDYTTNITRLLPSLHRLHQAFGNQSGHILWFFDDSPGVQALNRVADEILYVFLNQKCKNDQK